MVVVHRAARLRQEVAGARSPGTPARRRRARRRRARRRSRRTRCDRRAACRPRWPPRAGLRSTSVATSASGAPIASVCHRGRAVHPPAAAMPRDLVGSSASSTMPSTSIPSRSGAASWSAWRTASSNVEGRCSPIATRARTAAARSTRGRSTAARSAARLRAPLLPAAGGPLDGRRAPAAPAGPAPARAGGDQGGAVNRSTSTRRSRGAAGLTVSGLRGLRSRAAGARPSRLAGRSAATCAGPPCRPTTGTCSTSTSARSSASARAAGRCARASRSSGRPGTGRSGSTDFELPEEIWAQFRIPIGLAFFMYSSVTDCVVALYPSPAGATESELHFETWSRLADMNPVLRRPRTRRRGADRQPHVASAGVRDRPDRPLLRAGRARQGVLGGHLRRRGRRAGDRGLFRASCREQAA